MTLELMALPHDVLLTILQQTSLGPLELCHLECCSRSLRGLIDNNIWRQAFLQHRRCNALREPESWKAEYARRENYSRQWRHWPPNGQRGQTMGNAHRLGGQTSTTQKLRRFTLKMMSGSHPTPPVRFETHVVDQNSTSPNVHLTIGSALLACKPFDQIHIRSGKYYERLRLDKAVELVGTGPPESVVLIGIDGPAIEVSSAR